MVMVTVLLPTMFLVGGCFGPPEFPEEMEVFLTQETSMTAQVNTGPPSMADAQWDISRRVVDGGASPDESPYGGLLGGGFLDRLDPGERMVRVHFDESGRATLATRNAFYVPQLLGDTINLDSELHTAPLAGLSYAATSYGTEAGNQVGIALHVEIRLFGIPSATAVVYAWGPLADGRIEGVFGYTADLAPLITILLGSGADQYPVLAERQP
ncbi:MAG: hypothetical protein AABZ47_12740 [Planctomycetota bacterium]